MTKNWPLLAETVGREIPPCTLYCRDARWSAARNG